jgi:hypothetical protein
MDIVINELTSRVQATDSQKLLDPRVMAQIVQACVRAVKEDTEREKRFAKDRDISDSAAPERK